jgi:hypothetical protein
MPTHIYAWTELIGGLLEQGIAQDEIDTMARVNPARLLGIDRSQLESQIT